MHLPYHRPVFTPLHNPRYIMLAPLTVFERRKHAARMRRFIAHATYALAITLPVFFCLLAAARYFPDAQ